MKTIMTLFTVLFISLFSINIYAQTFNVPVETDDNNNPIVVDYFINTDTLSHISFKNIKDNVDLIDYYFKLNIENYNVMNISDENDNSYNNNIIVFGNYSGQIHSDFLDYNFLLNSSVIDDTIIFQVVYATVMGDVVVTYNIYINNPTLNINENKLTTITNVSVFPNPVINHLTIDFETTETNVPVELYSSNGALLQSNNDNRSIGRNSVQMDVNDYPAGVYLVKVGNEVEKVVKN